MAGRDVVGEPGLGHAGREVAQAEDTGVQRLVHVEVHHAAVVRRDSEQHLVGAVRVVVQVRAAAHDVGPGRQGGLQERAVLRPRRPRDGPADEGDDLQVNQAGEPLAAATRPSTERRP